MAMVETGRGIMHQWQCDHMGHINIRAYLELFDAAAWQLYAMVGLTPSLLRSGAVHMAAVQQNVSYQKELLAGDTVAVRTAVLEIREKVLRFRHELLNTETNEVCSTCEFTVVCLDPEARRSRPFPPEVVARARELMTS